MERRAEHRIERRAASGVTKPVRRIASGVIGTRSACGVVWRHLSLRRTPVAPRAPLRRSPLAARSGVLLAVLLFSYPLVAPRVRFVPVDANVRLEVLDWGGTGKTIVLLAGGGNTAHVFD